LGVEASAGEEPRTRLSRKRVLRAAIDLADEGGIDQLSIRKLAQRLGTRPMSMYYYVPSKDDLLSGILDIVVGEMNPAGGGGEWKAAIRSSAISAYEVLLRHPWACTLMMSPARVRPARLRYMDSLLGRLRDAGFSAELTDHAYHALDSHIIGFTLWQTGYSRAISGYSSDAAASLLDLVASYPYLAEHAQQHMRERRPGEEGDFAFGLDLILNSLEQMLGTT
jgi:AcrR family transcriptional regulator